MKKKKLLLILIFIGIIIPNIYSQNTKTQYVNTERIKGSKSNFCAEENYSFTFDEFYFNRIDNYDGKMIYGPSKVEITNYDENGYYYELRSPKYLLDLIGIESYNKEKHFLIKILYDKRGGNVLYIHELDMDNNVVKFYLTKIGYEKFCE